MEYFIVLFGIRYDKHWRAVKPKAQSTPMTTGATTMTSAATTATTATTAQTTSLVVQAENSVSQMRLIVHFFHSLEMNYA